ncbi:putative ATP-dependent RNA helicase DHX30 [Portunus trituberculatus]|uniref:Putative ATP-dependent RNA helicase DHX30 n=1 Tax=Portunus trituberculatus TaxID=210409 RepID=A0A5B7ET43_PORTR|nr:putative ATP-dependent RNA helicase DHX30 [Portunus trituberculatus]
MAILNSTEVSNTQQTLATLSHSVQTGNLNWMGQWGTGQHTLIRHIDLPNVYNSRTDLIVLGNHYWIFLANSQQQRAGRQAGEVLHLYSSEGHQAMSAFPVPESMRSPLEHASLQYKAHCSEESVGSVLAEGMSVPSCPPVTAVVANLERLPGHFGTGSPQQHSNTRHLIALGRMMMHMSTPPPFPQGHADVVIVFRCVEVLFGDEAGEREIGVVVIAQINWLKDKKSKENDHCRDVIQSASQPARKSSQESLNAAKETYCYQDID